MILELLLTFLRQGQICVPILLYGEMLKNHFLKMYEIYNEVKLFSYNQNFVPCELSALATKYPSIKSCNL